MNDKEEYLVGTECSKQFLSFWKELVSKHPQYNNVADMLSVGFIFFEGFSAGYDHHKQKLEEIMRSN